MLGAVPPAMEHMWCFSQGIYDQAKLLVPRNSIENYQSTEYWCYFANIHGFKDTSRGDVNGDGEVNIGDINMVIDAIISGNYSVGDVNDYGEVNISDITDIIDCMLSE